MTNQKQILFLTPFAHKVRGNVITTQRISSGYQTRGFRVRTLAYAEGLDCQTVQGEIRKSSWVHVLHITRFAEWLAKERCAWDKPFLLTMGGTDIHVDLKGQSRQNLPKPIVRLLDQASYVTVFSASARRILKQLDPRWADKTKVIPQGIVLPPSPPVKPVLNWETARKKGYHILLPAGLRPVKDVLFLLEAWERLYRRLPKLQVTIVGECYDKEVYAQVKKAMVKHPFLTYKQAIPFEEMGSLYSQADLVVNSSLEEGHSAAVCEAMGLGLPVIARRNDGNEAVIEHGKTGYLFYDQDQFIDYVDRWLSNQKRAEQMLRQAKKTFKERYDPEREIEAYLALLSKIA